MEENVSAADENEHQDYGEASEGMIAGEITSEETDLTEYIGETQTGESSETLGKTIPDLSIADDFEDEMQGYLVQLGTGEGYEDEWGEEKVVDDDEERMKIYEGLNLTIPPEDPRMAYMRKMTILVPSQLPRRHVGRHDDDDGNISGDFEPIPEGRDPFRLPTSMDLSIISEDFELEPEIVDIPKSWLEPVEVKLEDFTKLHLMQKCKKLLHRWIAAKVRNSLLERNVGIYMKTHGMRHTLKETYVELGTLENYHEKLNLLNQNNMKYKYIQSVRETEIETMQKKRNIKAAHLAGEFDTFQKREHEVAKGMTFRSTGKELTENRITMLMNRQKRYFQYICDLRLEFYRESTRVAQKEKELNELDYISTGLYLGDFETMKLENRNYHDKIEEKDDELNTLRSKCRQLGQIIAHVREKSTAYVTDIVDLENTYWRLVDEGDDRRRKLNETKQERDFLRQQLQKLKSEGGLLAENALLRDMENSLEDVQVVRAQLKDLQDTYTLHNKHLRNLRKYRETMDRANYPKEIKQKKAPVRKMTKAKASQLYEIEIPAESYDHVKKFSTDVKTFSPDVKKLSK